MMTTPGPQQYYNPTQRPSPYRPPLLSQAQTFSRYQSQYQGPISQQLWRHSKRSSDRKPTPPAAPQCQYTQQPFCQTFMPQHQNYPYNQRQTLSPAAANSNSALRASQNKLLAPFSSEAQDNPANRNAPCQPGAANQPGSRQLYQSNPLYHGYQKSNEKGVYQINNEDADPHGEGFYTSLDHEGKEVQYSDEGFDEVDANFVGVKTLCGKCGAPFFSKSRLHKHLKKSCISSLQPSISSALAPNLPIPIITSRSMISAMGSGLAFRG